MGWQLRQSGVATPSVADPFPPEKKPCRLCRGSFLPIECGERSNGIVRIFK